MMNAEQIFQAIQSLPLSERRRLLDRLSKDVQAAPQGPPAPIEGDDDVDLVGFLADDPEVADEIQKIATLERTGEDMREWHDAPSSPR
jgi:hypothetical protein